MTNILFSIGRLILFEIKICFKGPRFFVAEGPIFPEVLCSQNLMFLGSCVPKV